MFADIHTLATSNDFSFAETWLLSFFALMWAAPLFWAAFLSAVFGHYAVSAVKALITLITVLPIGHRGVTRYKQFMLIWSYVSAQHTTKMPISRITRTRKVLIFAHTLMNLMPGYWNVRDADFAQLHELVEGWCPFGAKVWLNGVAMYVTWYPNFNWERRDEHLDV